MCRVYGKENNAWTRLCYRTGRAGTRVPGDARGPNGHVPQKQRLAGDTRRPLHRRRQNRTCALCGTPTRHLDDAQRCNLCHIEIARGDRPNPSKHSAWRPHTGVVANDDKYDPIDRNRW